jgi:hypothetical protein
MDENQQARVSPTRFVDHSCSRGSSPKHSGFDVNGGLLRRPGERSLRQRPGRILKRTVSSALGRTVGVVILLFAVSCAHRGNGGLPIDPQDVGHGRIDTEAQLRALYGAVLRYFSESATWPASLGAACKAPEKCLLLDSSETPTDSWDSLVLYSVLGNGFELRSAGPDRKNGTTDDLVISYPTDRSIARELSGCYRAVAGWWSGTPTIVRLDTLSGAIMGDRGTYLLQLDLPRPPDALEWFPISRDSVLLQWTLGPHVYLIRLRHEGQSLRGQVDLETADLYWMPYRWRGELNLRRVECAR